MSKRISVDPTCTQSWDMIFLNTLAHSILTLISISFYFYILDVVNCPTFPILWTNGNLLLAKLFKGNVTFHLILMCSNPVVSAMPPGCSNLRHCVCPHGILGWCPIPLLLWCLDIFTYSFLHSMRQLMNVSLPTIL